MPPSDDLEQITGPIPEGIPGTPLPGYRRRAMEGQSLDRYDVLEKVGEGGMATVYRGHHRTLGREVALKVLHPHLSGVERNRQRFEREAKAIETLRHPNIVEIFDYSGRSSDECFIVTEFIEGFTLKAWLEDATLPSEVAASIGVSLCDALHYAHGFGIVHRDIKPENVMIRPDGHIKLMDFGIARVLDDSKVTMTGGLVGSPAYMSPEQALDAEIGPQSDQFSLGILLYRAVTGHLPFVGKSPPIILKHISEGTYADIEDVAPTIDPDLARAIRRALAQDPAHRFPSAEAMGDALRQVLKDAKVPESDPERARYFSEPKAYTQALSLHVQETQLARAKGLLEEGETAQAMAILGRILAIDDSNEEVLDLLSQLHKVPTRRPLRAAVLGLALLIPLSVVGLNALRDRGAPPTPLTESAPLNADASPEGNEGIVPLTQPSPTPTPLKIALGEPTPKPGPPQGALVGPPGPPAEPTPKARAKAPIAKVRAQPRPRSARPTPTPPPQAIALKPSHPGTLDLQSSPWAEIFVDGSRTDSEGRAYGNTLRAQPISLEPGRHTLRLVNPRCAPLEVSIDIDSGQIIRRDFKVCPRLTILGLGPDDAVEVNGVAVNRGAPILLTSTPKVHNVAITRATGERILRTVTPEGPQGVVILDLRATGDGS